MMSRFRNTLFMAAAFVTVATLTAPRLSAQIDLLEDLTSQFDTTSAFAYCEYDSSRIVIRDNNHAEIYHKVRLRILRESGLRFAAITLYDNSFSKLENFEGRVIGNNGHEIIKRSKKDMYKECGFGPSYTLYDDICTYTSNLSGGNFPFTIEYADKVTLVSLFFWTNWIPEQSIPVKLSSYIVDAPLNFDYASKLIPADLAPSSDRTTTSDRSITAWSAGSIPALDPPPCSPPEHDLACRLQFSPRSAKLDEYPLETDSWAALARTHFALFRDQLKIGDEAAAEARRILGSGPPTREQLAELHKFLMSRQRYVAVAIGVGGWQPHDCNLTYRNRYGDCKDLSTLYAAMLSVAGVEAHVALARTKDIGQIDPDFPALANFNHVILLYLNGRDSIWVDPTCSACDVGDLPRDVEGIPVLVVDAENGALVRTPTPTPDENLLVRNINLSLAADNSALAVVDIEASGNPGHNFKQAARELTTEELGQYFQSHDIIPTSFKIERLLFDKFDSTFSHFSCRITGSLRRASIKIADRLHLKENFANSPIETDFTDLNRRTLPLLLGSPLAVIDTITVIAPEGWQVATLPPNQALESQFERLEVTVDSTASIRLVRKHTRETSIIDPADFDSFSKFQDDCKRLLAPALIFQPR